MQINCITHRLLDVLTLVLLASRAGSVAFVTYITDMLRLWVGRSRMPNNDQQKVPPTTLPAGHGFYKSNWCLVSNDGHGKCWIPRKSAFAGKLGATTVKVLAKKRTSPINRTRNVSKYGNNDIITMDVSPRYWQFFGRRTGGPRRWGLFSEKHLSSGQRFRLFVRIVPGLLKISKISDLLVAYFFFTKICPNRQDIWPKITTRSVLEMQENEVLNILA